MQLLDEPNTLYRFTSEYVLDEHKNQGGTHVLVKDPFGFKQSKLVSVESLIWDSPAIRSRVDFDTSLNPHISRPESLELGGGTSFDTHFSDGTPLPPEPNFV